VYDHQAPLGKIYGIMKTGSIFLILFLSINLTISMAKNVSLEVYNQLVGQEIPPSFTKSKGAVQLPKSTQTYPSCVK
jgi:hypothetical protein